MTPLQVHPERATFDRLATEWPLVPVWAEVLADVGTPVGLFPAVAGDGPGLLLESVERSERWGRYSFMAGDPAAVMIADDDGLPAVRNGKTTVAGFVDGAVSVTTVANINAARGEPGICAID